MTITRQVQAERANNLVVMSQIVNGSPMRFADLADFMKSTRNVTMARSTWHLLRSAEHKVVKLDVLTGVASFFGVDERFLAWEVADSSPDYVRLLPEIESIRIDETTGAILNLVATLPFHLHEEALVDIQRRLSSARAKPSI
ncbi:hypothetical protein [Paeniglutamicibacter sp. NPDC091659]|uniref:hypothetical protein n=1 Tax=Paeniglutamicibacter sp. NPDC091659 TaxID=3364389 RepID=UPI00381247E9